MTFQGYQECEYSVHENQNVLSFLTCNLVIGKETTCAGVLGSLITISHIP